jgi:hypothetical protein
MLATFSHSGNGTAKASFPVYRSTNGGVSWTASAISTITDTQHGWDLDGPTLYELPRAEGNLPAGAILAAGTAWNHADYTQQSVEVFASTNQGASWSYRSSCTPAPDLTRPCRSPSAAASSLPGSHSWQQP